VDAPVSGELKRRLKCDALLDGASALQISASRLSDTEYVDVSLVVPGNADGRHALAELGILGEGMFALSNPLG
jgi:hypothetical protein